MNTFPSLEMRQVEWAPQAPFTMCWSFSFAMRFSFEGFICWFLPTIEECGEGGGGRERRRGKEEKAEERAAKSGRGGKGGGGRER